MNTFNIDEYFIQEDGAFVLNADKFFEDYKILINPEDNFTIEDFFREAAETEAEDSDKPYFTLIGKDFDFLESLVHERILSQRAFDEIEKDFESVRNSLDDFFEFNNDELRASALNEIHIYERNLLNNLKDSKSKDAKTFENYKEQFSKVINKGIDAVQSVVETQMLKEYIDLLFEAETQKQHKSKKVCAI